MKVSVVTMLVLFLGACSGPAPKSPASGEKEHLILKVVASNKPEVVKPARSIKEQIEDTLSLLPEVIKANHHLDSLTHHKHGISLWVERGPTKAEPFYFIKVGYNGDLRFETYYIFRVGVTGRQMKIEYLDVVKDQYITLSKWRKERRGQLPYDKE